MLETRSTTRWGGLCKLFGMTKQAYYKFDENRLLERIASEDFAVSYIMEIRKKDPGIGGMKLWHMYRKSFEGNIPLGRDRFADITDKYGLKVRMKVRKPRTTDSSHGLPVYPNLVKEYIPLAPNRLWVNDITYITIWLDAEHYCFCYLSLVLDAYSEEIVGWCVGDTLDTAYPLKALEMALQRIKGLPSEEVSLIHHSDRGCQYASSKYIDVLKEHGIQISMTESGDPKDNAQAERINNTMKNELLKGMTFHDIDEVTLCSQPKSGNYTMLRFLGDFADIQPHIAMSERQCSVFLADFGVFERISSVFSRHIMQF